MTSTSHTIRLIHTADNHIGLRFAARGYSDSLQQDLIEERFNALGRIVGEANRRKAHFLVIAGDLFDHLHISRKESDRTAELLKGFLGVHVVILPGNHDFFEPGRDTLWGRFAEAMSGQLLVLLSRAEPTRVPVEDREVVFYPGPCTSKTSSTNAIGWIAGSSKDPLAVNIGVAHGSVMGISPDNDERYFPMSPDELSAAGVDVWLLGHTHVRYPKERIVERSPFFFPSTHTPDGFDCTHEGYAWYLEIGRDKSVKGESIQTGSFRFLDWRSELRDAQGVVDLEAKLSQFDAGRTLLRLTMSGRLSTEEKALLSALLSRLAGKFRHLDASDDRVALNIDQEFVDRQFPQGSLPHLLLSSLCSMPNGDLALQLAYDLLIEARQ